MDKKWEQELQKIIKDASVKIKQEAIKKVEDIYLQEKEEIRKAAVLIANETLPETFLYQYGNENIDPMNIKSSIISVAVDSSFNTIVIVDSSRISFIPINDNDINYFNLNATENNFLQENNSMLIEGVEADVRKQKMDTNAQLSANNVRWKGTAWYTWANKRNRQGGFQSINKTIDQAKNLIEERVQSQIKNKIKPSYDKKMKSEVDNLLKGVK